LEPHRALIARDEIGLTCWPHARCAPSPACGRLRGAGRGIRDAEGLAVFGSSGAASYAALNAVLAQFTQVRG